MQWQGRRHQVRFNTGIHLPLRTRPVYCPKGTGQNTTEAKTVCLIVTPRAGGNDTRSEIYMRVPTTCDYRRIQTTKVHGARNTGENGHSW
jgi:hypothetical protein